ncbi:MAG: zinc-ribbon domain-containing protein [Candidatus Hodarchaeales archaeon]|jgi:predicted amidophosphoribosyltransferase
MVFCSKCGKELPENAYFCPICGVKTAKGIEANVSMPYGEMFSEMEKKLEQAFLTASEDLKKAFNKAREGVKRATHREPIICPSCGEKNSTGEKFCHECGEKLS